MGYWNMQEHYDLNLFWADDGRSCRDFPTLVSCIIHCFDFQVKAADKISDTDMHFCVDANTDETFDDHGPDYC